MCGYMATPEAIHAAPKPECWCVSALRRVYVFARRSLIIISPVIALWVLVGSCMDPAWWFGLLWGGQLSRRYVVDGLDYLVLDTFSLPVVVVVAFFVLIIGGLICKTRVLQFLDKFGKYLLVASAFVLIITALVVRRTQWKAYTLEETMRTTLLTIQTANHFLSSLGSSNTAQHVAGPVDFHFIDNERILALYSQIESDLSEEKRTVSSTGSIGGKVGVATGTVSAEAEAAKRTTSTSSFAKTELSNSKKCLLVMNSIIEKQSPKHYSSREDWILRKADAERAQELEKNMTGPVNWDKLKYVPPVVLPTPEQLEEASKKTEEYDAELQRELQSLRGYVFVDGEFDRIVNGDSVTFVRKFSTQRGKRAAFRFNLPKTAVQGIPEMNRPQLAIFGDVLHSADKDGYVDVRPLAVY